MIKYIYQGRSVCFISILSSFILGLGSPQIFVCEEQHLTWHYWFSIIIVPAGCDPQSNAELWEYWVAKIKDICAFIHDENSNTVRVCPSFMHFTLIQPLFPGLGMHAMVLLRQRHVRCHKIFVCGATTNHYICISFFLSYWPCISNHNIIDRYEHMLLDHYDFIVPIALNSTFLFSGLFHNIHSLYLFLRSCNVPKFVIDKPSPSINFVCKHKTYTK